MHGNVGLNHLGLEGISNLWCPVNFRSTSIALPGRDILASKCTTGK